MNSVESFGGVWERTVLFEPVGVFGPEEEQLKNVIWVQSSNGMFIDIRYEDGETIHSKMKSFAGEGSFDPTSCLFTWTRNHDFRPPGPPDVGRMRVLKADAENLLQLEEDGVLPGDDYREIWDKICARNEHLDCSVRLRKKRIDGSVEREGLFLIVGTWFALTLARHHSESAALQLQSIFAGEDSSKAESYPEGNYLWEHVCAMGSSATWEVQYALHSAMRGDSLHPARCAHPALAALFINTTSTSSGNINADEVGDSSTTTGDHSRWYWDVVHGVLPSELAAAVQLNKN